MGRRRQRREETDGRREGSDIGKKEKKEADKSRERREGAETGGKVQT